ncbi:hypothetical protein R1sor_007929 [Riccia sorocarpa]|uniref:Uncharacterized protein n=1 Tax=Riccia sorocarpa TaxID=122646 RepID=A0ABD3HRX3_9MARC
MNERVPVSPPFDSQILRNKLDGLVKKYRAEKQKHSQTGAAPSTYESLEEVLEGELDSSTTANQSFTEFLFGDEMGDMIPPGDVNGFAAKDATPGSSNTTHAPSFLGEGGPESPKAVPVAVGAKKESSAKSVSSPRSKACSQPGIQGKPNKKRKSSTSDDIENTMKELVQVFKDNSEEKKKQEHEKIQIMRELMDMRRMENGTPATRAN